MCNRDEEGKSLLRPRSLLKGFLSKASRLFFHLVVESYLDNQGKGFYPPISHLYPLSLSHGHTCGHPQWVVQEYNRGKACTKCVLILQTESCYLKYLFNYPGKHLYHPEKYQDKHQQTQAQPQYYYLQ